MRLTLKDVLAGDKENPEESAEAKEEVEAAPGSTAVDENVADVLTRMDVAGLRLPTMGSDTNGH